MPDADRFDPAPEDDEGYEASRELLRQEFTAWAEARGSPLGPDAIEYLVHYKWGYLDRHLTRWSRADLDEVLLQLVPAKVVADEDSVEEIVPEACAFVSFLAETGLLDAESEDPQVLAEHLGKIGPRFRAAMADRSRYSFGKRFWTAAAEAGVQPDDEEAVEAFITRFNSRPPARRARDGARPARREPAVHAAGSRRPAPRRETSPPASAGDGAETRHEPRHRARVSAPPIAASPLAPSFVGGSCHALRSASSPTLRDAATVGAGCAVGSLRSPRPPGSVSSLYGA